MRPDFCPADIPASPLDAASLPRRCLDLELERPLAAALSRRPPLAWIGSGMSRIAAELGMRMSHRLGCAASVFTPLEYCCTNGTPYTPVLISYGGSNVDILSAARHIAAQGPRRVVLLTGFRDTACEKLLAASGAAVDVVALPEHARERRFVAVMPLMALCGLALRLTLRQDETAGAIAALELAARRAEERRAFLREQIVRVDSWRERRWIVLGGGLTMVAALAWQVLLAEAALADVVVADLKDYSHGRYLSALQRRDMAFLVLSDRRCQNLGRTLTRRFEEIFPAVHVQLDEDPLGSLWAHLALACMLIEDLCLASGWDLGSPPRPAIVQSWSNWGRILPRAVGGK